MHLDGIPDELMLHCLTYAVASVSDLVVIGCVNRQLRGFTWTETCLQERLQLHAPARLLNIRAGGSLYHEDESISFKLRRFLIGAATRLKWLGCIDFSLCRRGELRDETLMALARCPVELKKLVLHECVWISDRGAASLSLLPSLRSLNMNGCESLTDEFLMHLRNNTNLETLRLGGCFQITDEGAAHLAGLSALKRLNLDDCAITDLALRHVAKLPLRELYLGNCRLITDRGMEVLGAETRDMRNLNLWGCENISDSGLKFLTSMTNLRKLCLEECTRITDAGLLTLSSSALVHSLRHLDLQGCGLVTGEYLERFGKQCIIRWDGGASEGSNDGEAG